MRLPEYVTIEEVKRVCKELKLRDWTALEQPQIMIEEAAIVLAELDCGSMNIDPEDFCQGLEVELEHGTRFDEANVTNNHPILTGKIVLAHLKESLDYYKRLDIAEIEGDILKAVNAGKLEKIKPLFKKLAEAKLALANTELEKLA